MKNKTKRILATAMCGILTVSSTVFIGSTVEVDEDLERAKELAKSIFVQVEEEQEQPYYYADYMKGLDGEEDYIIVGRHNASGYAVFERSEMELVEYSETGEMPITNTNTSYYAGPANYYVEENEEYKHIGSGEKVDKQKGKEKAKKVKEKIKKIKKDRKEKKEKEKEEKQKEQQEQVEQAQIGGMSALYASAPVNDEIVVESPGSTGGGLIFADDYTVVEREYISDYQYFQIIKRVDEYSNPEYENCNYGYGINSNNANCCATVAAQLLLSYNNWSKDGRIITQSSFLPAGWNDKAETPYAQERLGTTSNADDSTSFFSVLKGFVNPVEGEGVGMRSAVDGINNYLSQHTDIYDELLCEMETLNVVSFIKDEIDADRPVWTAINTYTKEENSEEYDVGHHAIVVYGYQTFRVSGENVDGFIGHYGWGDYSKELWTNADWVNGAIYLQTAHTHTDSVLENNSHIIYCSTCERTKPTGMHTYVKDEQIDRYDDIDETGTPNSHWSDSTYHDKVCTCGYRTRERHFYVTYKVNERFRQYHDCWCSCGYGEFELPHRYKYGTTCHYCGYENDNG